MNALHPHIAGVAGGVAGGITVGAAGVESDYTDLLGHGTAVMAAVKEKAPDAQYFAVRVFHNALRTSVDTLLRGIEWCIDQRMDVINLSLGTSNAAHGGRFASMVARAAESGALLVSASNNDGLPAYPGSLPGVIGVDLDWDLPRDSFAYRETKHGPRFFASGYPRSAPGVPRQRNLNGISFAVANMTGFVVRACERTPERSYAAICAALAEEAGDSDRTDVSS